MSLMTESCQSMFDNAGMDTLFLEPCQVPSATAKSWES